MKKYLIASLICFNSFAQKPDYNTGIKNGPSFNVVTGAPFNAKGNGTSGDSAAIQAALNFACTQSSSRVVTIPPPTGANYVIDATLSIPCDNIHFKGSGDLAKLIIKSTVSPGITTNKHSHVTIENLFLAGPGNVADQVCIYVDSTGTSTTNNTIVNNFIGGCGAKPPLTISGSAIKVRGDNLELEVGRNILEVWGTGADFISTNDLLWFHENVCGTGALTNDSGFCITMMNSAGAGRQLIEHNNIVTPGGAANFISGNGGISFLNNQYEDLVGSPNLSNSSSTAVIFGPALKYRVSGNNVGLHSNGNYCFNVNSFSGGIFEDNACYNSVLAQWNNTGIGNGLVFDNNNDGTPNGSQVVYTNPNVPGVRHNSWATNLIGFGTPYPRATYHFNGQGVLYNSDTTLAADIIDTTGTSVTVTSSTSILINDLLYIGTEQFSVQAKVGPILTVSRGENKSVAATHTSGYLVTFGPGGIALFTSTRDTTLSFSIGMDNGITWLKSRVKSGSLYIPAPIGLDLLQIKSSNTSVNTQLTITGISGQGDYPFRYLKSNGTRLASIDSTGGVFELEGNTRTLITTATTGGIIVNTGALDGTGTLTGTFSAHPYELYSNSLKHVSLPTDGGLKIISVTPPACDVGHEGTLFYFSGTPATVKACMLNSGSTYTLVTVITAP